MSDSEGFCAYCGEDIGRETRKVSEHILACEARPEVGLILKIKFLEEMGDNVLNALHETVAVIADLEGPRSKSWEIFRMAQEGWEIAKNTSEAELAEAARAQLQEET